MTNYYLRLAACYLAVILKSTQCISGVVHLTQICLSFWECTVLATETSSCQDAGPGVSSHSVLIMLALQLWLQGLLQAVILLLPFCGKLSATRRIQNERANALWLEARDAVWRESVQRNKHRRERAAEAKEANANEASGHGGDIESGGTWLRCSEFGNSLFATRSKSLNPYRLITDEEIDQLIEGNKIGLPLSEALADETMEEEKLEAATRTGKASSRTDLVSLDRAMRSLLNKVSSHKQFSVLAAPVKPVYGKIAMEVRRCEGLEIMCKHQQPDLSVPFVLLGPREAITQLRRHVVHETDSASAEQRGEGRQAAEHANEPSLCQGAVWKRVGEIHGGILSPLSRITISSEEEKVKAGIPPTADYFAFAFPLPLEETAMQLYQPYALSSEEPPAWLDMCLVGGFVYFDVRLNVVGANALSHGRATGEEEETSEREEIELLGPTPAPKAVGEWLAANGRMVKITLNRFNGFDRFAWVNPGEAPGGTPLASAAAVAYGAFVYLHEHSGNCYFYRLSIKQHAASTCTCRDLLPSLLQGFNGHYASAKFFYRMLTYPQRRRTGRGSAATAMVNPLLQLLNWDTLMLRLHLCLIAGFMTFAAHHDVLEREVAERAIAIDSTESMWLLAQARHVLAVILRLLAREFWSAWRAQISFSIAQLPFALSALPFFVLKFGALARIFHHAAPTGYNKDGKLTRTDQARARWPLQI